MNWNRKEQENANETGLTEGEGGDDNDTGLKERGGIEMSTTVLPFTITIITI